MWEYILARLQVLVTKLEMSENVCIPYNVYSEFR